MKGWEQIQSDSFPYFLIILKIAVFCENVNCVLQDL
jgi:hypothetical protein